MSDGSQGGPPPGWYADTTRADRLRWWDGAVWTEQFRPKETDASPSRAASAEGSAQPAPAVGQASRAQRRATQQLPAESDLGGGGVPSADTDSGASTDAATATFESGAGVAPTESGVAAQSRRNGRAHRVADEVRPGTDAILSEDAERVVSPNGSEGEPAGPGADPRSVETMETPQAVHVWPAPTSMGSAGVAADLSGGSPQSTGSEEVPPDEESHASVHVWPAPSSLAADAEAREAPAGPSGSVAASGSPLPEPTEIASPPPVAPPSESRPPAKDRPPQGEQYPDQIAARRPASVYDRPPAPIVYQPVSSSYVGEMRPPLPEAAARNVPARASIVLIFLGAAGGIAVIGWLANWDRTISGMVSLVSVALAAGAFFLAIGGLIVATQRSMSRVLSLVALVVSVVLVAWLVVVATEQALAILG